MSPVEKAKTGLQTNSEENIMYENVIWLNDKRLELALKMNLMKWTGWSIDPQVTFEDNLVQAQ